MPIAKKSLKSIFHFSLPSVTAKGKKERKQRGKETGGFNGAGLPIVDSEFVVSLHYRPPVCGLVLPPAETLSNRLVFCQNLKSPSPILILLFPRSVVVRPACLKSFPSQVGYISMRRQISYPNRTGYQVSPIKYIYTIHLLQNIQTEVKNVVSL